MKLAKRIFGRTGEMHMEQGPIGRTLLLFAAPVFLSQVLQEMYSIADCMIVGNYAEPLALAAAGEGSLILSVMINFFVGFSTGVGAAAAAAFGAQKYEKLGRIISGAMLLAICFGAVMTGTGISGTKWLLHLINCPADIQKEAGDYLRLCMLGVTAQFIYNMGNAILRALGNTKTPLYFLSFSAVFNIVLDLLLVAVFHMGLAGAAVATAISQWVLAALIMWKMKAMDEAYGFTLRKIENISRRRFQKQKKKAQLEEDGKEFAEIWRVGFPSGMQAVFMSISSMVIQYSINAFGADAAAGMVVFAKVEGFLYYPAFSYGIALTGFIGQNYGAGRMDRVKEGTKRSMIFLSAFTVTAGFCLIEIAPVLLRLFTTEPSIIERGQEAVRCIFPFYFLYAINQVYMGTLKGLGHTTFPMVCCLICYCMFRVIWCQVLLPYFHDIRVIYFSYDVSWILMIALLAFWYHRVMSGILCRAE